MLPFVGESFVRLVKVAPDEFITILFKVVLACPDVASYVIPKNAKEEPPASIVTNSFVPLDEVFI